MNSIKDQPVEVIWKVADRQLTAETGQRRIEAAEWIAGLMDWLEWMEEQVGEYQHISQDTLKAFASRVRAEEMLRNGGRDIPRHNPS